MVSHVPGVLILKQNELLMVQQEAGKDADVDARLDQVANVQLLLHVANRPVPQVQLSISSAEECAAKEASQPR